MSSLRKLALVALVAQSATAHFLLHYPTTIGFRDDDEGSAPCGSFTPDFTTNNVTDFYVDSDVIALQSTHPAATWLFRATLDITASGNWTSLLPAVAQQDLGAFCEKGIIVPSSWAGSKGVISVVQAAADGLLYQCAAVNFKSGSNPTIPSSCTNVTGLTAAFTTNTALSSIPATAVETSTATSASGSATGTSTTKSAAGVLRPMEYGTIGVAGWVVLVGGVSAALALL